MRKLSELLQLVKNNLGSLFTGLCHLCSEMYHSGSISVKEYRALKDFLYSELPKEKAQYRLPGHETSFYHFPVGEVVSREIWLESKIEELQKDNL